MKTQGENMIYVLDTHVLIWYFIGSRRLNKKLRKAIDESSDQGGRLLVPTITLAEALDINEKGKVNFEFNEMFRLIKEEPEFEVVGFGLEIFIETMRIKGIKEIHDRIIVATARFFDADVLTKDRIIGKSGEIETI